MLHRSFTWDQSTLKTIAMRVGNTLLREYFSGPYAKTSLLEGAYLFPEEGTLSPID